MSHPPLYRLPAGGEGNTAAGVLFGTVVSIFGCIILVVWNATQWTAWRFGYQVALGKPLLAASPGIRWLLALVAVSAAGLAVGCAFSRLHRFAPALAIACAGCAVCWLGPVYAPWDFFRWELAFGGRAEVDAIFHTGHWLIGVPAHFVFVLGIVLAVRRARRFGGSSDLHGSARWADESDVQRSGLLGEGGLYVGAWRSGERLLPLRHAGPQHVLGFAPSRSGKGVGWVLPTLLSWPHSVVVNDIKGENWALTAGFRQRELGHVCLRFDPTCGDGSSARYNPLAEVRRGPTEVRDAQNIADILVDPDGRGAKDHWDLTAQEILVGTILHVLYARPDKSLRGCLDFLTDPSKEIETVLESMIKAKHDPGRSRGWRDPMTGEPTATHPTVARAARSLLNKSENELSSVLSSATKFLSLYHDDLVAGVTSASDFCIADLVNGDRPLSLYLTVPPSDLSRTRPLLRLLIDQIGRRLTEQMHAAGAAGDRPPRRRLLLLMDEFAALGRLDFFQTQLAYLAGYGIQAFLIVQDLSQLYAAYGREESIVSNCHVRVAFAPNKLETARLLSEMAGATTVHKESRTYTGNRLNPVLMHVMASEQETHRPLLTPDEAMRLREDAALVFVSGARPIFAAKLRYFSSRELSRRARIAPPPVSDRLAVRHEAWTTPPALSPPVEEPAEGKEMGALLASKDDDAEPQP